MKRIVKTLDDELLALIDSYDGPVTKCAPSKVRHRMARPDRQRPVRVR